MAKKRTRGDARKRRHLRVRRNIFGTPEKPRLNVYRSLNEIYVQVIDDCVPDFQTLLWDPNAELI